MGPQTGSVPSSWQCKSIAQSACQPVAFRPTLRTSMRSKNQTTSTRVGEQTVFGHPKGLFYLAFTEGWERFSFYGMTALVVLYMVNQLLLPGHVEHIAGLAGFRAGLESLVGPLVNAGVRIADIRSLLRLRVFHAVARWHDCRPLDRPAQRRRDRRAVDVRRSSCHGFRSDVSDCAAAARHRFGFPQRQYFCTGGRSLSAR